MADDDPLPSDLAEAVLDGRTLDWAAAALSASESQLPLLAHLKAIASIASFGLTSPASERSGVAPELLSWGALTILGRMGGGSFGDVYRACDPKLDRPVALKLLRHRDHSADEDESAVITEGRLMARVHHPNVVTVYGAERIDGRVGIWMQLVDGRTLQEELAERGPLSETEVARIGLDLCGALSAIHKAGLIHRDLKAQNVLRDPEGQVLVTDFGAGRAVADVSDGEARITGTPLYLAPEILQGARATARSDIYSLGVLMFHLVTGSYPVQGQTISEIRAAHREGRRSRLRDARPGLSTRFMAAVEGALELDPARRFGSARELEAVLLPRSRGVGRPLWVAAASVILALTTAVLVIPGPWRVLVPEGTSVVARQLPLSDWMSSGGPSKDGRLFSFVDSTGNVAVLDLVTKETRRLTDDATPEGDGQYGSPVLSADARFVVAAWWGKDDPYTLRVVEVENKHSRSLTSNEGVEPVEWSRDGASILSILTRADHSNQLALVSAADGGIQVVKDLGPVRPQHVSLSPDGEFLVYDYPQLKNASARDIFIIRRDGSDERRLIEFPATDVAPVWTSEGDRVVFASDRSGAMDLWSVEVRGGVVQGEPAVLHRNIGRILALGTTDKGAYYYHQTVGAVDVYDAPLESESSRDAKPISTTYSGSNISSLWSPDGRRIALASRRGPVGFARGWTTLAIRDLETQEQREVTPAMNSFLLRSWSPDGGKILVQGQDAQGRTGAYAIDVETGRVSSIVLNAAGQNDIRRADWRPDGSVVYINSASQKLLARDPSTGREHVLLDLKIEGLKVIGNVMGRGFRLSPDGKALAYTVNDGAGNTKTASLWIRPLSGGASKEFAHATAPETLMFQDWTPDGAAVLFTRWDFQSPKEISLWRVSTGGGEPESLGLAREALRDVSVNPSGSRITFTAGNPRAEIWALENLLTRSQPKL